MQTRIEINAANLLHNFDYLQKLAPGKKQLPVLKSNAYGHGLTTIATVLAMRNPPFFLVQTLTEAALVRSVCSVPILVLGYVTAADVAICPYGNITFSIGRLALLAELSQMKQSVSIHLCLNTGMNREGMSIDDLAVAIDIIKVSSNINFTGIWSHLADADDPSSFLSVSQQRRFSAALDFLQSAAALPQHIHIANSAGFLNTVDNRLTGFRAGMAGYGFDPGADLGQLRPVLRLVSKVVELRDLQVGDSVGYGCTYKAQGKERIGVIPVGYYEALDRRLSNSGWLLHHGKDGQQTYLPIRGRISMNQTCFDTGGLDLSIGDELTVISNQTADRNSVSAIAKQIGTIPDEVVIRISAELPVVLT